MNNCPTCNKEFQFDLYVTYEPVDARFRDIECPHCNTEFSEYEED